MQLRRRTGALLDAFADREAQQPPACLHVRVAGFGVRVRVCGDPLADTLFAPLQASSAASGRRPRSEYRRRVGAAARMAGGACRRWPESRHDAEGIGRRTLRRRRARPYQRLAGSSAASHGRLVRVARGVESRRARPALPQDAVRMAGSSSGPVRPRGPDPRRRRRSALRGERRCGQVHILHRVPAGRARIPRRRFRRVQWRTSRVSRSRHLQHVPAGQRPYTPVP